MRDILLLGFIVLLCLSMFKKPFYGVLAWCWVSYMLPHKLTWGFMNHFPVAQVVAISFVVSLLFYKESKKIAWTAPIGWWVAFNLSMILSFLVGPKDYDAVPFFTQVMKVQIFTFLIYIMLNSRKRVEQTLWVICLSVGFYGVKGGIFAIVTGGANRVWGPSTGYFSGNNELGLALLMVVPLMYYLGQTLTSKWLKYGMFTTIFLCLMAVLGTQSRGALVAILTVGGFFWLKSNRKFLTMCLLIFMLPIGYSFMPDSWHERMSTIVASDEESYDGSIQGRFNAWRMATNLASDHILGGGFDAFNPMNFNLYAPRPDDIHDAHSIYFKVIGLQGFPGFFIFMAMWISAWRLANAVQKLVKEHQDLLWADQLSRMLQLSFIAYASGGAFLGLSYFDLPYHMLISVSAIYVIVKRELKDKEPKKPPQGFYAKQAMYR